MDLTYDYDHVGSDPATLKALVERDHADMKDKPSVVVVGQAALAREDGAAILAEAQALAEGHRLGLYGAAHGRGPGGRDGRGPAPPRAA